MYHLLSLLISFFFNDTATTEIYTLSLPDALPIYGVGAHPRPEPELRPRVVVEGAVDRKSTRLNSSHRTISYACFCLKKKKKMPSSRGVKTPKGGRRGYAGGLDFV